MDGLSYTLESRNGRATAVGTWTPTGGDPIYFEVPFSGEDDLARNLLALQSVYARLRG